MHILIVSRLYPPEPAPSAYLMSELAEAWAHMGHQVTVITGFPSWLQGDSYKGYRRQRRFIENVNSVKVVRVWHTMIKSRYLPCRMMNISSFAYSARMNIKAITHSDLIYVATPAPTHAEAALALSEHYQCPCVVNIQDLHPDASIETGFIRNPLLIWWLRRQESFIYRRARLLAPIGHNFMEKLEQKGVPNDKLFLFPNWIDTDKIQIEVRDNPLRKEWGIGSGKFVVLYAGTMGRQHNTMIIPQAAEMIKDNPNILFLLVGQGFGKPEIESYVKGNSLTNVMIKAPVPRDRLAELQGLSDLSLVTLRQGGISSVPSKILGYMAAGRPILASVQDDCDIALMIREADCGEIIPPGDARALANVVSQLYGEKDKLRQWGTNSRNWVEEYGSKKTMARNAHKMLDVIFEK